MAGWLDRVISGVSNACLHPQHLTHASHAPAVILKSKRVKHAGRIMFGVSSQILPVYHDMYKAYV